MNDERALDTVPRGLKSPGSWLLKLTTEHVDFFMSSDQAARLRLLVTDDTSSGEVVTPRAGTTLSVVGAKGGVGTSTVALNLAVALSMVGDRVELATHDDLEATERDLDAGPAGVAMRNAVAWQTFCSASRHRPPLPSRVLLRRTTACPNGSR